MESKLKLKSMKLIEKCRSTLIGSISSDGYPDIKAMLPPREVRSLKEIFFSTNTSSMRVKQFLENPKASLYFYSEELYEGLLLEGKMNILTDIKSKTRIWREGDTLYYKKGIEDPDYCVLHFVSENGRFYENFLSENFVID